MDDHELLNMSRTEIEQPTWHNRTHDQLSASDWDVLKNTDRNKWYEMLCASEGYQPDNKSAAKPKPQREQVDSKARKDISEAQGQIRTLNKGMRTVMAGILEVADAFRPRIEKLEEKTGELASSERVADLMTQVETQKAQIEAQKKMIDRLSTNVSALQKHTQALEKKIGELKHGN
jgi:predicted  nucleic acid-binding Zn-ribbon protein